MKNMKQRVIKNIGLGVSTMVLIIIAVVFTALSIYSMHQHKTFKKTGCTINASAICNLTCVTKSVVVVQCFKSKWAVTYPVSTQSINTEGNTKETIKKVMSSFAHDIDETFSYANAMTESSKYDIGKTYPCFYDPENEPFVIMEFPFPVVFISLVVISALLLLVMIAIIIKINCSRTNEYTEIN
jgi:hypothetical protein